MDIHLRSGTTATHAAALDASLIELLERRAASHSTQLAFAILADGEVEEARISYAQLAARARVVAAHLQRLRDPGTRALVLLPTSLHYVAALFGCWYAGMVAVPAYPPRRERVDPRLLGIVQDADVGVVLSTGELLRGLADLQQNPLLSHLSWVALDEIADDPAPRWQRPDVSRDSLAVLQYTSGSTGIPRGVMVSHGNAVHNAEMARQGFGNQEGTIGVGWAPLFHDLGLMGNIIQPLHAGMSAVLMPPESFAQKPFRWLKAISDYRASASGGPNFAYDLCLRKVSDEQLATLDLSSWKTAFNGAEPVRRATLEAFSQRFAACGFQPAAFCPCYGMAETTVLVSTAPRDGFPRAFSAQREALLENRAEWATEAQLAQPIMSCGRPFPSVDLRIVDPTTLRPCAERHIGEIWVAGPDVAQGYWRRPEVTRETFAARLAESGEGPFLRTGDLGFLHEGEVYVTGRCKDLIIIRGQNHYPQDIELTAGLCHPALNPGHGTAFSIERAQQERLVVVHEVKRSALEELAVDAVVGAMREAISARHNLTLDAVVLLQPGTLPRTSSGKLQRRRSQTLYQKDKLAAVATWHSTDDPKPAAMPMQAPLPPKSEVGRVELQQWLLDRLAKTLRQSATELDVHKPFAAYGLDSAAAVGLSGELSEWLGRPVPATLLYDYPSVAALVLHLSADTPANAAAPRTAAWNEPIAIVGIGCRFPQADDPAAFWRLLVRGGDAISRMSPRRRALVGDPDGTASWGGYLDDVEQFDAAFFGIAPREASQMDPQQRLLLEVSWQALEDAAIPAAALAGSQTGVFIGICSNDYGRLQAGARPDAWSGTGNALSIAANRLSYQLDLRGPSKAVDTACSSSLVAIHDACHSLLWGECELALAGGVNLCLTPDLTQAFTAARMLAADGRCKTFDAAADGYVRGEGCGVLLLKRLSAASAAGDQVLAIIRATAVNQDGRSNGLTAPNGPAQQAVIQNALRCAGARPEEVGYVEAHGTGTALGDPIEMGVLKTVYGAGADRASPCFVGSVKTNIGHLEAAAGIAGVIKAVQVLRHRLIPPHLHLQKLNPAIELAGSRLQVTTQTAAWPTPATCVGISSFGFGGTNAHLILGPAPSSAEPHELSQSPVPVRPPRTGLLSHPFQRRRYWIDAPRAAGRAPSGDGSRPHGLLGRRLHAAHLQPGQKLFTAVLGPQKPGFLADHQVFQTILLPASAYVEMALAAGLVSAPAAPRLLSLEDLRLPHPLVLTAAEPCTVQTLLRPSAASAGDETLVEVLSLQVAADDADPCWHCHATGRLTRDAAGADGPALVALQGACREVVDVGEMYRRGRACGMEYGPAFQAVASLWRGPDHILAALRRPATLADDGDFCLHPVLLDAAFQAVGALLPVQPDLPPAVIPVGLGRLQLRKPGRPPAWAAACLRYQDAPRGRFTADLWLFDAEGQPVADLMELELRTVSRELLLGAADPGRDLFYSVRWQLHPGSALAPQTTVPPGRWLVLSAESGAADTTACLVGLLRDRGHQVLTVSPAADWQRLLKDTLSKERRLDGVIYGLCLGSADDSAVALEEHKAHSCGALLHLVQALVRTELSVPPRLWLVTDGAVALAHADSARKASTQAVQAMVWGMAKVIRLEHPELRTVCVDLDKSQHAADRAQALLAAILSPDDEDELAFCQGQAYVPRLQADANPPVSAVALREDRTYLITGGHGGLGLHFAAELAARGARHLVLLGRSAPPLLAETQIGALRAAGVQVHLKQADVADREQLAQVLAELAQELPPLGGVIHGAGELHDGVLAAQDWATFAKVLRPKVDGAWNLHLLTASLPLDFLLFCSSAVSLLGAAGQAAYAAANAYLDALAHKRRSLGRPALSINWGAWAEIGMAARGSTLAALQRQGARALSPAQGRAILGRLLACAAPQLAVLPIDWPRFRAARPASPLLIELGPRAADSAPGGAEFAQRFADTYTLIERRDLLVALLQTELRRVLQLDKTQPLPLQQGFFELGMDSLMALEFRNRVQSQLALPLSSTALFKFTTLSALAEDLLERLNAQWPMPAPPDAGPAAEAIPEAEQQAFQKVLQMSPAHLEELIDDKLKEFL